MKRIFKYGLYQAVTFIFVLTAISYWVSGNSFYTALVVGVIGGIIVGVLNGLLFYKFTVPKYVLDAVLVDLDTDEIIRFQTTANFTSGKEPVSGKLFLTNKRAIFKNHTQDKNVQEFSIDISDIAKVDKFKTLKLFQNGLAIQTTSNVTHKFIVDRLQQWLLQFDRKENGLQQKYLQKQG